MFPTTEKIKISSSLSYPVNAKLISEALADVPQASFLAISFVYWRYTARLHECSEPYPVLAVEYSYRKASQFTPHHLEEAGECQPKWGIWVQPVPSLIKHRVKELLQCEALPKMHKWLFDKQNLTGVEGKQSFTVWLSEANYELLYGE